MQSIARQEIYYGRYFTQNEVMREIDSVSLLQVKELAYRLINEGKMSLTILGPAKEEDFKGLV
jgi:predicted Zn-dependent peptidase